MINRARHLVASLSTFGSSLRVSHASFLTLKLSLFPFQFLGPQKSRRALTSPSPWRGKVALPPVSGSSTASVGCDLSYMTCQVARVSPFFCLSGCLCDLFITHKDVVEVINTCCSCWMGMICARRQREQVTGLMAKKMSQINSV